MIALIICLAILFLLIGHFVVLYILVRMFFGKISIKKIDKSSLKTEYSKPYATEMIKTREELLTSSYELKEITSFDGLKLTGYYFNNDSDKTIIMFHGFHTTAFNNFGYQTRYFLAHKYNVLVVNQRSHVGSEGKYSTYGQKESKDVLSWVNFVEQDNNIKDIYLYGISMGATSIAFASEYLTNSKVKFLILEGIFSSVDELTNHIVKSQHIPTFFFKHSIRLLSHLVTGIKWNDKRTMDALKNNLIPTIFVHGTKDIVAIKDFFIDNYNACLSKKYQIIVEGAPHALCALHAKDKHLDDIQHILGETQ